MIKEITYFAFPFFSGWIFFAQVTGILGFFILVVSQFLQLLNMCCEKYPLCVALIISILLCERPCAEKLLAARPMFRITISLLCISCKCLRCSKPQWLEDLNLSPVTRKPVFGVFEQVRLKPACSATETS